MFSYRGDPLVSRYQSFRPHSIAEVERFIKRSSGNFNVEGTWHQVGIFLDGTLIGDIGIHFIGPDNTQCEIGYTLAPDRQGKGLAAEAVSGVIDYLFSTLGKHRVLASIDPDNAPSLRLVEKLGFRKEAHFRKSVLVDGAWRDDLVYGLLAEEWKGNR